MGQSDAERRPTSLRQVLDAASFVDSGDVRVRGISCDSRTLRHGELFAALVGPTTDGHDCVQAAVAAGASAVLVQRPMRGLGVPQCVVPDTRAAWALLCMAFQNVVPSRLTVAGVTGTNGKTTTSWLLRSILACDGRQTGLLGTIEYSDGVNCEPATLTTPDARHLADCFSRMIQRGTTHCVMELSSHALDQRRCHAVQLAAAAITNITQDHFDYHGNAAQYRAAKSRIVQLLTADRPLLLGADDEGCQRLRSELPPSTNLISFGFDAASQLRVSIADAEVATSSMPLKTNLRLRLSGAEIEIRTSLVGRHNALNCLAAAGLAEQLGVCPSVIARGLEQVSCVPGRMEYIDEGQQFQVFVDYAHTPDGLRHCLQTIRSVTACRVICVFGAGGNRDSSKRPLMARAAEAADMVVVTSDNPRSENPGRIIDDIVAGFAVPERVFRAADRTMAIQLAFNSARPGDTVVIAGRGHESLQQIGDRQISFDDRRVARRILRTMKLAEAAARSESRTQRSGLSSETGSTAFPEQISA